MRLDTENGAFRPVPPPAPEAFVDAEKAAEFLAVTRRRVLDLVRQGALPAHALGAGQRKVWRFRLSELSAAVCGMGVNCNRQSPAPKETNHDGAW
jgi:excisionase family DNA binding protein